MEFCVSRNSPFRGSETNVPEGNSAKKIFKVFRVSFVVLEWFKTSFQKFFLMLNSEISGVFSFLQKSSERNSEHFYFPENGLERK
jgi:hypothetical protein